MPVSKKEVLTDLIKKIEQSKTIWVANAPSTSRLIRHEFRFDTFNVRLSYFPSARFIRLKTMGKFELPYDNAENIVAQFVNHGLADITVKDKEGNIIITQDFTKNAMDEIDKSMVSALVARLVKEDKILRAEQEQEREQKLKRDLERIAARKKQNLNQITVPDEKEFFADLIKKIRQSKTIWVANARGTLRIVRHEFRFDTFDVKVSYLSIDQFMDVTGHNKFDIDYNAANRIVTENKSHGIADAVVKDKKGNIIVNQDFTKEGMEEVGKFLFIALITRLVQEDKRLKKEELKKALQKVVAREKRKQITPLNAKKKVKEM